jgi:hypothetical protein
MDDERPEEPDERADALDGTLDSSEDSSEDAAAEAVEEAADVVHAPEPSGAGTSHPAVDEVLRSLERLEDVPVEEHVAAFEQAHDELRRALAEARDHGE